MVIYLKFIRYFKNLPIRHKRFIYLIIGNRDCYNTNIEFPFNQPSKNSTNSFTLSKHVTPILRFITLPSTNSIVPNKSSLLSQSKDGNTLRVDRTLQSHLPRNDIVSNKLKQKCHGVSKNYLINLIKKIGSSYSKIFTAITRLTGPFS